MQSPSSSLEAVTLRLKRLFKSWIVFLLLFWFIAFSTRVCRFLWDNNTFFLSLLIDFEQLPTYLGRGVMEYRISMIKSANDDSSKWHFAWLIVWTVTCIFDGPPPASSYSSWFIVGFLTSTKNSVSSGTCLGTYQYDNR